MGVHEAKERDAGLRRAAGGYRKGEEARVRILEAALVRFGLQGFRGATTRQIAADAGVSLPALKYYFGNKEGLHRACALEIVQRHRARVVQPVGAAQAALSTGEGPEKLRHALRAIIDALADLLVTAPQNRSWAPFVLRELAEAGPAFEVLHQNIWQPGVELVAHLIARIEGRKAATLATRIDALLLVSGLSAFGIFRPVALRFLGWPDVSGERLTMVKAAMARRIERLSS